MKGEKSAKQEPTKEFLAAFGLYDFYDTRTKSFNRGNMVGKDTHVSRLGRNVHLNYILRIEDSLEFDKFRGRRSEFVEPCGEAPTKVLVYRLSRRIHVAPAGRTMRVVQQRTTLVERTFCDLTSPYIYEVLSTVFAEKLRRARDTAIL